MLSLDLIAGVNISTTAATASTSLCNSQVPIEKSCIVITNSITQYRNLKSEPSGNSRIQLPVIFIPVLLWIGYFDEWGWTIPTATHFEFAKEAQIWLCFHVRARNAIKIDRDSWLHISANFEFGRTCPCCRMGILGYIEVPDG